MADAEHKNRSDQPCEVIDGEVAGTLSTECLRILQWLAEQPGAKERRLPPGGARLTERPDFCTDDGARLLKLLDEDGCIEVQVGSEPWYSPLRDSEPPMAWPEILEHARSLCERRPAAASIRVIDRDEKPKPATLDTPLEDGDTVSLLPMGGSQAGIDIILRITDAGRDELALVQNFLDHVGGKVEITDRRERLAALDETRDFPESELKLNEAEQNILEALGNRQMTGETIAKPAGYPYNSNFKNTLSGLCKRGILQNKRPKYSLTPKAYDALKLSKEQSQDDGQDQARTD